LRRLYECSQLYINFFQPSFKLKSKHREADRHLHKKAKPVPRNRTHRIHSLSESLLSSRSFTFDGQAFNFNRIAPHGITLTGITDYPVAFAAAGTTMAVGGSLSSQ
jgi:hypothetical protein